MHDSNATLTLDSDPEREKAADPSNLLLRERIRLLQAVIDKVPGGISPFDDDLRAHRLHGFGHSGAKEVILSNASRFAMLQAPDEYSQAGLI
ncbi:hypothetical protein NKI56_35575 [Mesorhizobium sp. M0622]|uniref:hypothetical protein n=1 Tax=unclassified Mesorhizobium TaxID=325217 RepID=UPI00333C7E5E